MFDVACSQLLRRLQRTVDRNVGRRSGEHFESEHRLQHRDGSDRWVLARGTAVRDADGQALRVVGSVMDVTPTLLGAPIRVGSNPAFVAVSADGSRVYVSNFNSGSVSVIKGSSCSCREAIRLRARRMALGV